MKKKKAVYTHTRRSRSEYANTVYPWYVKVMEKSKIRLPLVL